MKILFIVEKYSPDSSIAAVRPSKFVKYLSSEFGCEIDLLTTQEETDDSYLANTIHVSKCYSLLDKMLNAMLAKRKKTVKYAVENAHGIARGRMLSGVVDQTAPQHRKI